MSLISWIISSASLRDMQPRSHQRLPTTEDRGWIAVASVMEVRPLPSLALALTWTVSALEITLKNTSRMPTLERKENITYKQ